MPTKALAAQYSCGCHVGGAECIKLWGEVSSIVVECAVGCNVVNKLSLPNWLSRPQGGFALTTSRESGQDVDWGHLLLQSASDARFT